MYKFLKNLFFVLLFFIILAYFLKTNEFSQKYINLNELRHCDPREAEAVVKKLAQKLSCIKSFAATDIRIAFRRFSAKGFLYFEDNKLRLVISSFLGKEMDIGSNKEIFWFWSRRMRPQALYYSKHEDAYRTNLRPVFNRDWILNCFLFNNVDNLLVGSEFFYHDNLLVVKQNKKISERDVFCFVTVIDIKNCTIVEKYICDLSDFVIASVKYSSFDNCVPKCIHICWNEEGIVMQWKIGHVEINKNIEGSIWVSPDHQPRFNMVD